MYAIGFAVAAALVVLLAATGYGIVVIVPVVIVLLVLLFAASAIAKVKGVAMSRPEDGTGGVPTTGQASYEPVAEPRRRG